MRSIRRTVLFNVILLMIVTLTAVSIFVYRTTEKSILEKEETARQLIQAQFDDKRDEALLSQAYTFAREAQSQFNIAVFQNSLWASNLSCLAAPVGPSGHVLLTMRAAGIAQNPIAFEIAARLATSVSLSEDKMYRESDSPAHMFVQISTPWSVAWKSNSLAGESLDLNMAALESEKLYHVEYDTYSMKDGTTLRRVVMKAPITKYNQPGRWFHHSNSGQRGERNDPPSPRPAPPPASPRGPRGPGDPRGFQLPTIYIQCAWDTSDENPRLLEHARKRDSQIAEIEEECERERQRCQGASKRNVLRVLLVLLRQRGDEHGRNDGEEQEDSQCHVSCS